MLFYACRGGKKPTIEELISEVEKICESGKDFTNKNGTMKYVEACSYLGAAYEGVPEVGDLGIKKDLAKAFKFHKKSVWRRLCSQLLWTGGILS